MEIVFSKGFHDFLSLSSIVHNAAHLLFLCIWPLPLNKKGLSTLKSHYTTGRRKKLVISFVYRNLSPPSQNSLSALSFFLTFAALTARRSLRTTGTIVFYCGQMQSICSGKRAVKSQEKRRRHLRQVLGRRSVNEKKQYFSGSDTRTTIPRDTRAIYKLGEKND